MKRSKFGKGLTALALGGFVLGTLHSKEARASLYYLLTVGAISGATTSAALTTGGTAIIIVKMLTDDDDDYEEDYDEAAVRTRALIEAGLLTSEGELAAQITLLLESPTAFAQLNRELAAGQGPAVDALVRSTGLSADELAVAWSRAGETVGVVSDREQAGSQVMGFLTQIAGQLNADDRMLAELQWSLVRERSQPDFPASASSHQWLAEWLGVPVDSVAAATAKVYADPDQDLRKSIYEQPERHIHALSSELGSTCGDLIDAHIADIVGQGEALAEL
jgi:hypothetical protein